MNKFLLLVSLLIIVSCSNSKKVSSNSSSSSNQGKGDTRTTKVEMLDNETYLLTEKTDDKTYGFEQSNPIKVGERSPQNERRFLNALLGPNGETVKYFRAGSCCGFKTPNGTIGNMGLLDLYRVFWDGNKDTLNIYINMYDKGDLKIPVGFTAKQ
jgi:hypothetical protein